MRVSALVNVNMEPEEVAAVIGIDPSGLIQYGNGYAVIENDPLPLPLALVAGDEEE
jgi:hypothetical protein